MSTAVGAQRSNPDPRPAKVAQVAPSFNAEKLIEEFRGQVGVVRVPSAGNRRKKKQQEEVVDDDQPKYDLHAFLRRQSASSDPEVHTRRRDRTHLMVKGTKTFSNDDTVNRWNWHEKVNKDAELMEQLEHDLDTRKEKRQTRLKPWMEPAPPQVQRDPEEKIEIYYESYIPKDKWLQMKPYRFAFNHKYGQAYVLKTDKMMEEVEPPAEAEEIKVENDTRMWKLEQSRDDKQVDFQQGIFMENAEPEKEASRGGKKKGRKKANKNTDSTWIDPQKDLLEQEKQKYKEQQKRIYLEHVSAMEIQRLVRGWIVRNAFTKLKARLLLKHDWSWNKFKKEYRALCARIQKRYGFKASAPFDIEQINVFLDRKEKYQRQFEVFSIGDRLPKHQLKVFFNHCDHHPAEKDINFAYNAVFRTCTVKADVIFLLDCAVGLADDNFGIKQDLVFDMVTSLHVADSNVRIAYLPYNTEVFESFGFSAYKSKSQVLEQLASVKPCKGIFKTDGALKKMKDLLQSSRQDIPRIAVVMADASNYASHSLEKQAKAIHKDGVTIVGVAVGGGDHSEFKEIEAMATDEDHVFRIRDQYAVPRERAKILEKIGLPNCAHCNYDIPQEMKDTGNEAGLTLPYVLEIIWMVYPPSATGLDPQKRYMWMKPVAHDGDVDVAFMDETGDTSDYDTCLKFVIKGKLESEGAMEMPTGDGDETTKVTSWEGAMQQADKYQEKGKSRPSTRAGSSLKIPGGDQSRGPSRAESRGSSRRRSLVPSTDGGESPRS